MSLRRVASPLCPVPCIAASQTQQTCTCTWECDEARRIHSDVSQSHGCTRATSAAAQPIAETEGARRRRERGLKGAADACLDRPTSPSQLPRPQTTLARAAWELMAALDAPNLVTDWRGHERSANAGGGVLAILSSQPLMQPSHHREPRLRATASRLEAWAARCAPPGSPLWTSDGTS